VAIADMDLGPSEETAAEIRAAGGRAIALPLDVTKTEQVEAAVARAISELGRLDILVACAGLLRDNLLFRMTDDDWDAVIDTHLKGSFLAARAAQKDHGRPELREDCLSSPRRRPWAIAGNRTNRRRKLASRRSRKPSRSRLGKFGINVNAVAPGFIETRMTRATAERQKIDFEQMKAEAIERIPLRRVGQPQDVANVIAFLVSDESSYVSGQTIYVAGGPRG